MKIKEYLQRGWTIKEKLDLKRHQLQYWRAISTTADASNNIEFAVAQIVDLENEIQIHKQDFHNALNEIEEYLKKIELEDLERTILNLRYIGLQSWKAIAECLSYSPSYIWSKHFQILRVLEAQKRVVQSSSK